MDTPLIRDLFCDSPGQVDNFFRRCFEDANVLDDRADLAGCGFNRIKLRAGAANRSLSVPYRNPGLVHRDNGGIAPGVAKQVRSDEIRRKRSGICPR